MRETSWPIVFGVALAAVALSAVGQQSFDDDSYMTSGGEETERNRLYEAASKRALLALSRFKPFVTAFTKSPSSYLIDTQRYAAKSYLTGLDGNSLTVENRRGRPAHNPMRFGR